MHAAGQPVPVLSGQYGEEKATPRMMAAPPALSLTEVTVCSVRRPSIFHSFIINGGYK